MNILVYRMKARTTNSALTTFRFSSNSMDLSLISNDMLKKRAIFLHPAAKSLANKYLKKEFWDKRTYLIF